MRIIHIAKIPYTYYIHFTRTLKDEPTRILSFLVLLTQMFTTPYVLITKHLIINLRTVVKFRYTFV